MTALSQVAEQSANPGSGTPSASRDSGTLRRFVRSVRFRLTLWFVAILALIVGAFCLFIYFRQVQVTREQTLSRLEAQSGLLANFYRASVHSALEEGFEGSESDALVTQNQPLLQVSDALALVGADGQVLQHSGNLSIEDLAAVRSAWLEAPDPTMPIDYPLPQIDGAAGSQGYLFVVTPVEFERGIQTDLLLGGPVDPGGQLPRLALTLGLVYTLTLLVAFGGGYWLADRAMHPVQVITGTAREIGERDLSRRLHLGREDELGRLADTFDQMLDRLQRAFERQRQFTANASHELRTPLAVIELEADRALEGSRTSDDYRAALEVIREENEWMGGLVDQLLTLARMDSGLALGQPERLDLAEIAVEVIDRLSPLARDKDLSLMAGQLDESPVLADQTLMTHMLTNLVANGLKYSTGDQAQVLVEAGITQRLGRRWAWLRVADNGPGIPAEHLPHLFDRFYRVDPARGRIRRIVDLSDSGSGLGLAIVQSIARSLNGEVEVQSQLGRGTTFTVWLPEAT